MRGLHSLAVVLGIAGLIPFLGCGLAALNGSSGFAATGFLALLAYGAVVLSFLGGVHWGFVLHEPPPGHTGGTRFDGRRLSFAVLPALFGWLVLVLARVLSGDIALALLIVGFLATLAVEVQARRLGLVPAGYIWMRWILSAAVTAVLVTVLVLRLVGAHINF